MEVGPDGLLVFVPISFETLEPPAPVVNDSGKDDDEEEIVVEAGAEPDGDLSDSDGEDEY